MIKDIVDDFYKFVNNPENYIDNRDITFFLNTNMIAYKMIVMAIDKDEMIEMIEKDKVNILLEKLEKELKNVPDIEQYKIEICKKKLRYVIQNIQNIQNIQKNMGENNSKIKHSKDSKDSKETKKNIGKHFIHDMHIKNSVITLTFGDQAENHVGMEQIGKMVEQGQGFNLKDFKKIKKNFENLGANVELYNISDMSYDEDDEDEVKDDDKRPDAYLLVIRDGVNVILKDLEKDEDDYNAEKLFYEQATLNVDKKAFMYGRVVNKNARWNLCFDEKGKEPDYEKGKGRVVAFKDVPITKALLDSFPDYFGEKAEDLKGEGNYYYDIKKCGIGFHGDSERRKVLAVRMGGSIPIHYQWFRHGKPVGNRVIVPLNGGDIYLMSEKAVGTDWKKKNIYTLRHATGCDKFTKI